VKGPPSSSSRDKVTKRRRGKERVEWGRGPWRAVFAFLARGPRVPSYATERALCSTVSNDATLVSIRARVALSYIYYNQTHTGTFFTDL